MKKSNYNLFFSIILTFFKIGAFCFGGGYAMIPLIEKEIIRKKGWITEEDVIDVLAVAQSLPGAVAINTSTFIGRKIAGTPGAIAATIGIVLPSFTIITIIAAFFSKFQDYPAVQAALVGIRSAVVALILTASIKVGKSAIKDNTTLIIFIAAVLLVLFNINPILIIICGALTGIIICFAGPNLKNKLDSNKNKEIL